MPANRHYATMSQLHGLKTKASATFPGISKEPKIGAGPQVGVKPKAAKKVKHNGY